MFKSIHLNALLLITLFYSSQSLYSQESEITPLLKLAELYFDNLDENDHKLIYCAEYGNSENFNKQVINVSLLKWLCTNKDAIELVNNNGIHINNGELFESLDLSFSSIPFQIRIEISRIYNELYLYHTSLPFLSLRGSKTMSIRADKINVKGSLFLDNGFLANGIISLYGAFIGGNLDFGNANVLNKNGVAILADHIKINGSLFFHNKFKAEGEVRFPLAAIGGQINGNSASIINKSKNTIYADGIEVNGGVFLNNGFKSEGIVKFRGSKIGDNFDCENGEFNNTIENYYESDYITMITMSSNTNALDLENAKITGSVYLRNGFKSEGEINLLGAIINGGLDCENATILNKNGRVIDAENAIINGHVFFRKRFYAGGLINFLNASLGSLVITDITATETIMIDLRSCKLGILWDDPLHWQGDISLFLNGFEYDHIDERSPLIANERIEWLNRQPGDQYLPQPYEQLASVLHKDGYEEVAKQIQIEKARKKLIQEKDTPFYEYIWEYFSYWIIGSGYRPFFALFYVIGFIIIGWFIYLIAICCKCLENRSIEFDHKHSKQNGSSNIYTVFKYMNLLIHVFIYSIDVFIPLINLHQEDKWILKSNSWLGLLFTVFFWVQIAAGWLLTTFFVAGISGLVRI